MNLRGRQSPSFPPVDRALKDPNGLLAVGGALDTEWLTAAYQRGIFPWFDSDEGPILWWSPDPRAVIRPDRVRITRSLAKRLRNSGFSVTADCAFADVITACAESRSQRQGQPSGTWITDRMRAAYLDLHRIGLAHSIEVWADGSAAGSPATPPELVGGLYGVSFGRMFFGESMFSRTADASKIGLCHLARQLQAWNFWLIDCQVGNPHTTSLGAVEISRREFVGILEKNRLESTRQGTWTLDPIDSGSWQRSTGSQQAPDPVPQTSALW